MTATLALALALAAVAGAALGALHFALLWRATRRLVATGGSRAFALAALARMGLVLGALALFFSLGGAPSGLAAAALGFLAAREALARRISPGRPEG